jgi:filamentous hemagglutinin family protein
MNRIYRLIWNHTLGALVPVAEIVRAKGGGVTRRSGAAGLRHTPLGAALALALGLAPTMVLAQRPLERMEAFEVRARTHVDTTAQTSPGTMRALPPAVVAQSNRPLPTGGQVVAGQAAISAGDHALTIDQSSQRAVINWQSFDIGSGNTVTFHQPGRDSVALNRVLGTDPSAIYGHLNANGQVFLVNPYGVYFAPGAQVNVGGLVASTLGLSDSDFLAGQYRFGGSSLAGVRNDGTIKTEQGGYVAFLGRTVDNTGAITTPGGATALGAGGHVTLTLAGHELVSFAVDEAALQALVSNGGVITADGGRVVLSAQAKDALLQTVVNNTGRIRAQTVQDHRGVIDLLGGQSGTVQVAGTLDVSAPQGGDGGAIDTSGAHVKVAAGTAIAGKAANGVDGRWLIDPNDFIIGEGGDIDGDTLSENLEQVDVEIFSSNGETADGHGDILVQDDVDWSFHTLTLHAERDIVVDATMSATGTAGLFLQYGQGASDGVIDGRVAKFRVGMENEAAIDLASSTSFKTQLGSAGAVISYIILTDLGEKGSTTGTDLQGINGNLSGAYVLGKDIFAGDTEDWNGGFKPLGKGSAPFNGILEGLGHSIEALSINRSGDDGIGLFGVVGTGGAVRNLFLSRGNVEGGNKVGGLTGINHGSIFNVKWDGESVFAASGGTVGGLVGSNHGSIEDSSTEDSSAAGKVSGTAQVGGLVGFNDGLIAGSFTKGEVNDGDAEGEGSDSIGGLVGFNGEGGTIRDSEAATKVRGGANIGGLVGVNAGAIIGGTASGSVDGGTNVGGLVGTNSGSIRDSLAEGEVNGNFVVGGLVGGNKAKTGVSGDASIPDES